MKKVLIAALVALTSPALAQTPQPADWTTITLTADLNKAGARPGRGSAAMTGAASPSIWT